MSNKALAVTLIRLFIFVLIPAGYAPTSYAWGKFGHLTICEVAYREMTPDARTKLNRILNAHGEYTTFNRACLEADRFPRTRGPAHFANYPRSLLVVEDGDCEGENECVISAIASDYETLKDSSLDDKIRGEAMILLGHWVGDIHQPLHISYQDDRGGNSIKKRGTCSASNLHAVWDNCIIDKKILPGNVLTKLFGWQKMTRAYRAADELEAAITSEQRSEWIDSEVWEWAAESYQITISPEVLYCHQRNNECWYDANNKILDDGEDLRKVQMTHDYLDAFAPIVRSRLSQAGVRLGNLLNLAFDPQ